MFETYLPPVHRRAVLRLLAATLVAMSSSVRAEDGKAFTRSYLRAARSFEKQLQVEGGAEAAERFHAAMSEIARSGFLRQVGAAMEEQARQGTPKAPGPRAPASTARFHKEILEIYTMKNPARYRLDLYLNHADDNVSRHARAVEAYLEARTAYENAVASHDPGKKAASLEAYLNASDTAMAWAKKFLD